MAAQGEQAGASGGEGVQQSSGVAGSQGHGLVGGQVNPLLDRQDQGQRHEARAPEGQLAFVPQQEKPLVPERPPGLPGESRQDGVNAPAQPKAPTRGTGSESGWRNS